MTTLAQIAADAKAARAAAERTTTQLDRLPANVWRYLNPDITTLQAYSHLLGNRRLTEQLVADLAGLSAAVSALATEEGVDPKVLQEAAEQGVSNALAKLRADVTLTIEAGE